MKNAALGHLPRLNYEARGYWTLVVVAVVILWWA